MDKREPRCVHTMTVNEYTVRFFSADDVPKTEIATYSVLAAHLINANGMPDPPFFQFNSEEGAKDKWMMVAHVTLTEEEEV